MLIFSGQKTEEIPECEKCNSLMLPKGLELCGEWKCPNCMNEVKEVKKNEP